MGQHFNWVCTNDKCGKTLDELSGGPDRGFMAFTNTLACKTCGHIADYLINEAENMGGAKSDAPDKQPQCKNCGGDTIPWDRSCPDCSSPMKDSGTLTSMWD